MDFIVARTDQNHENFVPSYHWACAIDDFDHKHSLLVRASDLANAIVIQEKIYEWLGKLLSEAAPYPAVFHTSLVTDNEGHRLEKRTRGVTLPEMIKADFTERDLVLKLEQSFQSRLLKEFKLGKIWGEAREQLRLDEILN